MSWVTVIWSMTAAACLTLAAIHFMVWWQRRSAWAELVFTLTSIGVAVFAGCELSMMLAQTPGQFATALRWLHVPTWLIVVSLAGFVRLHRRAGRRWLFWSIFALRSLALLLNFLVGQNLNYREVTGLRHLDFLGETVSLGVGVSNPWMLVGQLSLVLLVILTVDATMGAWRRGARRQAAITGGSIVFFSLAGLVQAVVVAWQIVPIPLTQSFFFLGIVVAMGYEVSRDVLHAAQLATELQASEASLRESEQRMSLAVDAANLGIWVRDFTHKEIWASDRWRELFGFASAEPLELAAILQRVHPEDRAAVGEVLAKAVAGDGRYEMEYRVVLPDGRLRWISSRGRVEADATGQPLRVRGASRDSTARKLAEEAAHNLSGRLIHAQEETQRQLAGELHDDLSQSLALLSVELDLFGQNPPLAPQRIASRMEEFSAQVKGLSSEVHRLSHNLHPAKLDQLGLVAAVRGFCKEFALAHEIAVEFTEHAVPRTMPNDTALCLYRIAQESLQNVVKHSGGTVAKVELTRTEGHLCLVVTDDGAGFDPQITRSHASLGLVSMHERARFVGGRLTIDSRPGQGTRVEVRVPITAPEEATCP